jgi:hypothetical protein
MSAEHGSEGGEQDGLMQANDLAPQATPRDERATRILARITTIAADSNRPAGRFRARRFGLGNDRCFHIGGAGRRDDRAPLLSSLLASLEHGVIGGTANDIEIEHPGPPRWEAAPSGRFRRLG